MSLKGFEDVTTDINDHEIQVAGIIANRLITRPAGKKNAVTNKKIREVLLTHIGTKISDVRMRNIMQYIRTSNLVTRLCSAQTGYFVAQTDKEWEDWKTSMRQRIRQQEYTLACAEYFGDGGNEKL